MGGHDVVIDPSPPFPTHCSHYLKVVGSSPTTGVLLSTRILSNFPAFSQRTSLLIFLAYLTKVLVAISLIDLVFSDLRASMERSRIWLRSLSVLSFGTMRLSEQVEAHHNVLPLRYEPILLLKSVFTIFPISSVKSTYCGYLAQYIWISSINSPKIIMATSFLFYL